MTQKQAYRFQAYCEWGKTKNLKKIKLLFPWNCSPFIFKSRSYLLAGYNDIGNSTFNIYVIYFESIMTPPPFPPLIQC